MVISASSTAIWDRKAADGNFTGSRSRGDNGNLLIFNDSGFTNVAQQISSTSKKPSEATAGRTIAADRAAALCGAPMSWTTCDSSRPMTSSMRAALVRSAPTLVCTYPLACRMVSVVPRLVEQRAAPAAKHCKVDASTMARSANERPMGISTPVVAMAQERGRQERRALTELARPPGNC